MMIKWTEYPDDKARRNGVGGKERRGQVWAEGPSPGTRWAIPKDGRYPVLVVTRNVPGRGGVIAENWSLRE